MCHHQPVRQPLWASVSLVYPLHIRPSFCGRSQETSFTRTWGSGFWNLIMEKARASPSRSLWEGRSPPANSEGLITWTSLPPSTLQNLPSTETRLPFSSRRRSCAHALPTAGISTPAARVQNTDFPDRLTSSPEEGAAQSLASLFDRSSWGNEAAYTLAHWHTVCTTWCHPSKSSVT